MKNSRATSWDESVRRSTRQRPAADAAHAHPWHDRDGGHQRGGGRGDQADPQRGSENW